MNYVKRETWGYSVWRKRQQVGACVGLNYFHLHGMAEPTDRLWRKRGLFILN